MRVLVAALLLALAASARAACGPPQVTNARLTCPSANDGEACDVVCKPGYSLAQNTLVCSGSSYQGSAECAQVKQKFTMETAGSDNKPELTFKGPEDADAVFDFANHERISINELNSRVHDNKENMEKVSSRVDELNQTTKTLDEANFKHRLSLDQLNETLRKLDDDVDTLEREKREEGGASQCVETACQTYQSEANYIQRLQFMAAQLDALQAAIDKTEQQIVEGVDESTMFAPLDEFTALIAALGQTASSIKDKAELAQDRVQQSYQTLGKDIPPLLPDSMATLEDRLGAVKKKMDILRDAKVSFRPLTVCSMAELNSGTNNGVLKTCNFEKKSDDTYLKLTYTGNLRVISGTCIWELTLRYPGDSSARSCEPSKLIGIVKDHQASNINDHRPSTITGFVKTSASRALKAGSYGVVMTVNNDNTGGDCYTAWDSQAMIEIEEYPALLDQD